MRDVMAFIDRVRSGQVVLFRRGPVPVSIEIGGVRLDQLERDLIAVKKAPKVAGRRIPSTSEHDRARRRPIGRKALKPARPGDPFAVQRAHGCCDVRGDGGDGVVLVRLDSHDP